MFLKAFEERSIPDEETISVNYLPDRVLWSTMRQNQSPNEASNRNQSPDEANNQNLSPDDANIQNQSPDMVNNTDLPDMVEASEAQLLTVINYKDFLPGINLPY